MRFSFDRNYIDRNAASPSVNTPAVTANKLEALKLLADIILAEVYALEHSRSLNGENELDLAREVERFECDMIRCALVRTRGRQRKAARLLNIKPTTFHAKLKRYGILQEAGSQLGDLSEDKFAN